MPKRGKSRDGICFSLPIPMVALLKADRNLRAAVTRSLEEWWIEQGKVSSPDRNGGMTEPQEHPSCP